MLRLFLCLFPTRLEVTSLARGANLYGSRDPLSIEVSKATLGRGESNVRA